MRRTPSSIGRVPTIAVATIVGLRTALGAARLAGQRVALVPTMGALHPGHLALVERAKEVADLVVVSIFVNPLQFGVNEDLARYPRTLDADIEQLNAVGVTFAFTPSVDEMYPHGPTETRVTAGLLGTLYEGGSRSGHFDGVLTVVSKLINIVQPDVILFGQKDAQQVFLVRRMVADLDQPVWVETVPTVREPDGLALSSRNRFLAASERQAAFGLSNALEAARSCADRSVGAVIAAAQSVIVGDDRIELDYLKVVDPATFLVVDDDYRGIAMIILAARVGATRLIDNDTVFLQGPRAH